MIQEKQLFPCPSFVIDILQAILETGSSWAEEGTDPRTGVSCWGLAHFAYAQAGITLPASACEASLYFLEATRPYQAWDLVVANFSGMSHGPRHVGLLLAPAWGFHCGRATNGIAHFRITDRLWQRCIKHIWRLKELS